jgi:dihydropteroate synthase
MSATCASLGCGAILMHTRGRPHQWRTQPPLAPADVLPSSSATSKPAPAPHSLPASSARPSCSTPASASAKSSTRTYPLLAHLDQLHTLGFPILAGLSRKSFLTRNVSAAAAGAPHLASEMWDPTLPTTIANTAAILAGAHILRVHDVRPARDTAAIADRILSATE